MEAIRITEQWLVSGELERKQKDDIQRAASPSLLSPEQLDPAIFYIVPAAAGPSRPQLPPRLVSSSHQEGNFQLHQVVNLNDHFPVPLDLSLVTNCSQILDNVAASQPTRHSTRVRKLPERYGF